MGTSCTNCSKFNTCKYRETINTMQKCSLGHFDYACKYYEYDGICQRFLAYYDSSSMSFDSTKPENYVFKKGDYAIVIRRALRHALGIGKTKTQDFMPDGSIIDSIKLKDVIYYDGEKWLINLKMRVDLEE